MGNKMTLEQAKSCPIQFVLAMNDTLNVISGKWKLQIIGSLLFGKTRRFTEIQRTIPKITPRMLSKELKELELNGIVKRTVYDSIPVTIEYELTGSARQLQEVMDTMIQWGINHRKGLFEEEVTEKIAG
ncbi:winged helix-turn-helix transcriptional regulator [Fluviicola chungangensis]|uniref:Helix-turn-helix transcriptional regulator n=1 Tax=Fluviicola chungangensis TaxID=2597671 RepID=A0A556N7Q9_9FLAO|nr:helix-turn-helix domain-containing protein [Fluviicola chungangensis]TSJ48059.1 helix-turn-helix transcriptional regulator [Fluviicola chungangensis]